MHHTPYRPSNRIISTENVENPKKPPPSLMLAGTILPKIIRKAFSLDTKQPGINPQLAKNNCKNTVFLYNVPVKHTNQEGMKWSTTPTKLTKWRWPCCI